MLKQSRGDMQPKMVSVPLWKCTRCDNRWISRVKKPVRCPRCGSPNWDRKNVRPYKIKKENGHENGKIAGKAHRG